MKRSFPIFILVVLLCCQFTTKATNYWKPVTLADVPQQLQVMHPRNFLVYRFDQPSLRLQLFALSTDPASGMLITLPMPDGSFRDFNVWQAPMMPDDLASKYPEIRTFSAEAVNDRTVTAKLDYTLYGFHAMIFDGDNTSFIDPYDNFNDGYYMVHYKKDEVRAYSELMKCDVHGYAEQGPGGTSTTILPKEGAKSAAKTINGYQLRTYRLALSADHFYSQKVTSLTSPSIAQVLSKMTTTMNRVNGVYERELSVHMNFVANEDTLIWTAATDPVNGADPFNTIDANASACLTKNQSTCDARILTANYDIGHVFTTGGGGLSSLGVVCTNKQKAKSVTGSSSPSGDGFDIDYVAHEMGHEFSGEHPFNNGTDGSCGGDNRNQPTAYEPGSGSTIMAYAGICSPDNLQSHSDAYFHSANLEQMLAYINSKGTCAVNTPTGNNLVAYSPFAANYSIPYLTPFELTGPALTDSVADSVTLYSWEEWDLGVNDGSLNQGTDFVATTTVGPLFRSYSPVIAATRVFPKISMVLSGILSNAGINYAEGEKVPDVARNLTFKCTFRNILHNNGCVTIPDDQVVLSAINTGAGFKVTSQGTTGITYKGGSTQTISWDVVSTNVAPINAATVDIYISIDGGNTWPIKVGTYPNTGTASIGVPNPATTSAAVRFKVKGTGNVFFNVNSKNFTVTYNPDIAAVGQVPVLGNDVNIYPVPAKSTLHITAQGTQSISVFNLVGQQVWAGTMTGDLDIPVSEWVKGMYFVRLTNANNQVVSRKFVVE